MSTIKEYIEERNIDIGKSNVKTTDNANDIDSSKTKLKRKDYFRVDRIADRLVDEYKSPQSREFYCKVAIRLRDGTIDRLVGQARDGNSPVRLFNYLARKEMSKRKYDGNK